MNAPIGSMKDALRLTLSGQLAEATALIQRGLAGRPPIAHPAEGAGSVLRLAPARGCRPQAASEASRTERVATSSGSFTWHEARCDAGSRRYKLYVPATDACSSRPLVVMLHGCTQTPDDFAAGTCMNDLADEMGFLVAYPEQPRSANASGCWNWFRPGDQRRDAGEPSIIAAMVGEIVRAHDIHADRVFVAGLSAGGAAAAVMGQAYPDLFAAVGVHSGLACGVARDMSSAIAAMRGSGRSSATTGRPVPTIVFHGSMDRMVHPANAAQLVEQAGGRAVAEEIKGRSPDGTRYIRRVFEGGSARASVEEWSIEGAGHAWSGGSSAGSHADPRGPDASREMMRFFLRARTDCGFR